MTEAHTIIQSNVGKQPAEIINALHLAGFAIVPVEARSGCEGASIMRAHKPFADRYRAVVDFVRVKP